MLKISLFLLIFSGTVLGTDPVGLSLFFENGQMAPLKLATTAPRYLQEVDIVVTTPASPVDAGAQPLISSGEFASLNWAGLAMVDEDWRPALDGTFQRQRFYRNAAWMNFPGLFTAIPLNAAGVPVGLPLVASTGLDSQRTVLDDGFIRRFVVRQIATGCPAVNNCTGASFSVQGLVQWRGALRASQRSVVMSAQATQLRLVWTEQLSAVRTVPIQRIVSPFGHGFQIGVAREGNPANGLFYVPGESVSFRLTYKDGAGNRIHPVGSLPTFQSTFDRTDPSGLQYWTGAYTNNTLYYALKHREALSVALLQGPLDKLKTAKAVVDPFTFFLPQIPVTNPSIDGYSAVFQTVPSPAILFTPPAWGAPISDLLTYTIPADALPGTYQFVTKARRLFAGEPVNATTAITLQVGTAAVTTHVPTTGPCNTCHNQASSLGKILHGTNDRSTCYGCHVALPTEPDTALDIRVHQVHDRSRRFDANIRNCSQCHLTTPTGPARGILP